MTIDTTDSVGNTTDVAFSLRRSKKYPRHTKSLKIPAFFFCWG